MSTIRIRRPKQDWSVAPRTVLPTALIAHLFKPHWDYTVVLDDCAVGKLGGDQERVFTVEPGEHRLHMRFVGLRRSKELRMSVKDGEQRQYIVGTTGLGWPTLREASRDDGDETQTTSISEPPTQGDSFSHTWEPSDLR
jgi:hypothetical protein